MNKKIKKHSGEVSAIMGYDFQYSIFATEIYNALLNENNQIEWIEFASNNAGKLDDVLISLKDTILAFQVKNIESSTFTYLTFTESNTKSIIEGMFEGWKNIKASNPNKKVDVRFITTQLASTNDQISSFSGKVKPSFSDFLNKLWKPIVEGKYTNDNLPKAWGKIFQELLAKTKSTTDELVEFIKSTNFLFEYSPPKLFDSYIERQRRIDIEEIANRIFKTIATHGNKRFTKNEFLEHFGLLNRYESYYTHTFFVDEEHYQPIDETLNRLEDLIKNDNKGYIALIGNAGSGKSTLLTKWLQQGDYRFLKYYAYVNTDMSYEFGFRGEAKTFLHDLLIQIRQSKQSIQDRLPTEEIPDLQKHFNEELNKLSHEDGKTIIIVDGLDHIEREQDVTNSLIGILPLPENIPDNIYFILGSRTIENLEKLNPRIKNEIKDKASIINIKSLSKESIQNFLLSYQISLTEELLEKLFINTKGHPLFIRYTVEEIKNKGQGELDEIIEQRIFSGDIYKEYKIFYDKYKLQDDFIEILGLIARFRHSFFDIELLNSFPKISRANQYSVNKLAENYFYKVGNIWQFFHNSFKEFLIAETSLNILTGKFDKNVDKHFHMKICEVAKNTESDYKWNDLYHLY